MKTFIIFSCLFLLVQISQQIDFRYPTKYVGISRRINNYNNNYKCKLPQRHYNKFQSRFSNVPRYRKKKFDNTRKCVVLNSYKGSFCSAGYPHWYGNNLNQRYRFIQKPGYCSVKVHMLDFQLQNSYKCSKDYLLFNNKYRYCADDLCNQVFDLPFKQPYYDFFFITDSSICCRGFNATYELIRCKNRTTTTTPPPQATTRITTSTTTSPPQTTTTTTTPPPETTTRTSPITTTEVITTEFSTEVITTQYSTDVITTESSTEQVTTETSTELELQACGEVIISKEYNLEIFEYHASASCRFVVKKISDDVCALAINFIDFNLDCNVRILTIIGTKYCGSKSGEKISLAFNTTEIEILYQGNNNGGRNRILSAQLIQNNFDCLPDLEVPPS